MRQMTFDLGRRIGKRPIASRIFCLIERALPLHRLARSRHAVVFYHPRPTYKPHVLIVPTKPFPSLTYDRISDLNKSVSLWEMINLALTMTEDHEADWRMIINGGTRQEIGQVHGHLIFDDPNHSDVSLVMTDPTANFCCWKELFQQIATADSIAGNGYSVTFHLTDSEEVLATFSESGPT